jgi:hypothetical protein
MKTHINTIGIILTIVGSFLVWKYLTELSWADKEAYIRGEGILTIPSPTEADIKKFRRQLWLSKIGLIIIVLGGTLQIISNYYRE